MTQTVRPRAKDIAERMGPALYREAAEKGMNLSRYLEEVDPSPEYKDGLDAFSRQIKLSGIAVRSVPEFGVWSDEFDAFNKNDQTRALVPEWINRQVRAAQTGRRQNYSQAGAPPQERQVFLSSDYVPGSLQRPYADDGVPIIQQITPQIPLSALVARTTAIMGDAYRAFYLTRTTADLRTVRVGEAAEVPRSKLTGGEHTIRLHKFGRALETSYEQLRRMKIDMIATFIQLMTVQMEVDRVDAALDVLVNGDGNSNTAGTVYALTTLDPAATAGTLTLKGWLAYKMKFVSPYALTTMLAREATILQTMLLSVGSANIPLVTISAASGFGGMSPINPGLADNVRTGWTASAPSLKLVGFDARMALEHITEVGGDIEEIERYVNRQTQELVITTVDGFRTLDPNAVNILDVNS